MNHRVGSIVFGLVVGLGAAFLSYQWITNTDRAQERAEQERVVLTSRALLEDTLGLGVLELVDPLAPERKVGKVYVYPASGGWEVSGYYRRGEDDRWHPYLLTMSADLALSHLKVQDEDPALQQRAADSAQLTID